MSSRNRPREQQRVSSGSTRNTSLTRRLLRQHGQIQHDGGSPEGEEGQARNVFFVHDYAARARGNARSTTHRKNDLENVAAVARLASLSLRRGRRSRWTLLGERRHGRRRRGPYRLGLPDFPVAAPFFLGHFLSSLGLAQSRPHPGIVELQAHLRMRDERLRDKGPTGASFLRSLTPSYSTSSAMSVLHGLCPGRRAVCATAGNAGRRGFRTWTLSRHAESRFGAQRPSAALTKINAIAPFGEKRRQ